MVGLFAWMKQGRVDAPGVASSQAAEVADSVDQGGEVGDVVQVVKISCVM